MSSPLRVGLTGGIGSGKTTVSDMFRGLGVPVIDADEISRELTKKTGAAFQPIVELFGKDLLSASGELQRERLRTLIFTNAKPRAQLEAIIHPLVRKEIARQISVVAHPYCLISVPLLLEKTGRKDFDSILVVDCPERLQIARTRQRDQAEPAEIRKIIAAQADRQTRLASADDVIYNDQDLAALEKQVRCLHKKYSKLAQGQ